MKRTLIIAVFLAASLFASAEEYSRKKLFEELEAVNSKIKKNVKSVSSETRSLLKMDDNDFTMETKVIDYIDSVEYENKMTDNVTNEVYLTSGKSRGNTKIECTMEDYSVNLFTYAPNALNSHNILSVLPESLIIKKENGLLRITSAQNAGVFLQMYLNAGDKSLKSMQFKSYFGIYNVKVVTQKKLSPYLILPDSVEVYLNEKLVMASKVKKAEAKFK